MLALITSDPRVVADGTDVVFVGVAAASLEDFSSGFSKSKSGRSSFVVSLLFGADDGAAGGVLVVSGVPWRCRRRFFFLADKHVAVVVEARTTKA